MQNLKLAFRALRRGGVPFGVAIVMLAVAIGATTAIFSVVHAVLLRPLPFTNPEDLVMLWGRDASRNLPVIEVSLGDLRQWRQRTSTLGAIEIFGSVNWSYRITAPGESFTASYSAVSAGFFDTLGARPLLGRSFNAADDAPTAARTAILSADLWRRRFSSDPGIVGKTITAGEGAAAQPFEIIGVMDAAFRFPAGAELWTPATRDIAEFASKDKEGTDWDGLRVFYALGRVRSDATTAQIAAELSTIARTLEAARGVSKSQTEMVVTPFLEHFFGSARPALAAMFAAVAVLLLIACANAAGLLLVHGVSRGREIAVRLALGARRSEIVAQFFYEATILALVSGAIGVAVSYVLVRVFVGLTPEGVPRLEQVSINTTVLGFALALSFAIPVIVGTLPAWRLSSAHLVDALRLSSRSGTAAPRAGRLRTLLVTGELAAAVVLLICAGLLANSYVRLARVDLGFDPRNVLTFDLHVPEATDSTPEREWSLVERTIDRLQRIPGVVSAGAVFQRPLAHGPIGMDSGFILEGQTLNRETWNRNPLLNWEAVTPGYFKALGIRLTRGRLFDERDDERAPLVVIVSEALAARVWPGQDPLGKRLATYGAVRQKKQQWQTVVGVVADVRYREVQEARLDIYLPFRQAPSPVRDFVVKTAADPFAVVPLVQGAIRSVDGTVAAEKFTTFDRIVADVIGPWRFNMFLFAAFSVTALAFAVVGLWAVIAYVGRQRARELAIRVALGAQRSQVIRLLLGEGMKMVAAGLVIGLLGSYATTRLLSNLLFGVTPTDPGTFAGIAAVLIAVSLLSTYLPARTAARLDPIVALRSE